MKKSIIERSKEKTLILDGAMGTMIQKYRLEEEEYRGERFKDYGHPLKGNNDLLSITQPQIIQKIHEEFLEAGADIIETNTFNSNSISMEDYKMSDLIDDLNRASVRVAKDACAKYSTEEKPRYVAGSIGPTNKTASLSPDVNDPGKRSITFEDLRKSYYEQTKSLIEAGVDILLVETVFDTLNAKAALFAIEEVQEDLGTEVPVMVSGTITDASGRTLSGQTPEAFWTSISHAKLFSVGFNCALGAKDMEPHLEAVHKIADVQLSCHPNAGLPNEFGEYDDTPENMSEVIGQWVERGMVRIVGGCCGTTPAHIKKIAERVG